jgi:hypothetical protein
MRTDTIETRKQNCECCGAAMDVPPNSLYHVKNAKGERVLLCSGCMSLMEKTNRLKKMGLIV